MAKRFLTAPQFAPTAARSRLAHDLFQATRDNIRLLQSLTNTRRVTVSHQSIHSLRLPHSPFIPRNPPQPAYSPQAAGYPLQPAYPPQAAGYPPQPAYSPQAAGYPPQPAYPPQAAGYFPQPAYPPQPGYGQPPAVSAVSVNVSTDGSGGAGRSGSGAVLVEVLLNIFLGIYGVGWLMAGETTPGIILLICSLLIYWPTVIFGTIFTLGTDLICVIPLEIGLIILNAVLLNNSLKRKAQVVVVQTAIVQQPMVQPPIVQQPPFYPRQ